jgi:hypothetical protein
MSIPLDRLYHYIESVAHEIRGASVLIYRFYPHGSKNINDLHCTREYTMDEYMYCPHVICYDQEPLNYNLYNQEPIQLDKKFNYTRDSAEFPKRNLRIKTGNIYDQCILLHSESNSKEVDVYQQDQFVPVYYWSHAIIARDWFRYAPCVNFSKDIKKTFLIYNRAWSGTREYRLKFVDMLIENNLLDHCKTNFNPYDDNQHYTNHIFVNANWKPIHKLEQYLDPTTATSNSSADFDIADYNSTEFEIVLETLYSDQRQQLTEKILRPIACKQPFILASTPGSLKYLHKYGFQTFGEIIDESYDNIQDPVQRMQCIIDIMKDIASWTTDYKLMQMKKIKEITEFNHRHFFSEDFFTTVINEFKHNLASAFEYLENNNIGLHYRDLKLKNVPGVRQGRKNNPEVRRKRLNALKVLKDYRKRNRARIK